jgi:hypothetical protein
MFRKQTEMDELNPSGNKAKTVQIREAVGVFDSADRMEDAVNDLEENGFDRAMISLLSTSGDAREKLGLRLYDITQLEDAAGTPRHAFISSDAIGAAKGGLIAAGMGIAAIVAAGVAMSEDATLGQALIATMASGAVGLMIGGLLARRFQRNHSALLQEQIDNGGLLLWVRTLSASDEKVATEVLRRNGASDVHVHSIAA